MLWGPRNQSLPLCHLLTGDQTYSFDYSASGVVLRRRYLFLSLFFLGYVCYFPDFMWRAELVCVCSLWRDFWPSLPCSRYMRNRRKDSNWRGTYCVSRYDDSSYQSQLSLLCILCVLDRASSWDLNKGRPTRWHLLYYVNLLLNIPEQSPGDTNPLFQAVIKP